MDKPKTKAEKRKARPDGDPEVNDSSHRSEEGQDEDRERRSSRVKKPKLVYDPSDQTAPYKKITIEDLTKSPSKKQPAPEFTPEPKKLMIRPKSLTNFESKMCKVCSESMEGVPSVVCISCGDSYHCYCHEPRVGKTTRKSTWKCHACRPKDETPLSSTQVSTSADTSRRSSINKSEGQSEEDHEFVGFEDKAEQQKNGKTNGIPMEEEAASDGDEGPLKVNMEKARALLSTSHNNFPNIDTVPDCSGWECSEVFEYFNKYFPSEAYIFKDQEIDGTSLMLMTRSDMLKFNLKLGPALNIYRHVVMLQTRSFDPRNTWK